VSQGTWSNYLRLFIYWRMVIANRLETLLFSINQ
jgi:hypothetical protein